MSSAGISVPQPSDFTPIIQPLPRSFYPPTISYNANDFRRADELPDTEFYSSPRFVHHIDDSCISRLKGYYESVILEAAARTENKKVSIVDLCSSWTSHLPNTLLPTAETSPIKENIGIGLNGKELAANKHLTSYAVIDLNNSPKFTHVGNSQVDVVICSVSIDYLNQPVAVLSEIRRVLRPGGSVHFSFSNRCFPTKVVRKWLRLDDEGRRKWVGSYFWKDQENVGRGLGWKDVEEVILNEGGYDDPLFVVRAKKAEDESSTKSEL